MSNSIFKLIINNVTYEKVWDEVTTFQSMEVLAGTFEAKTIRFFDEAVNNWNINMGDEYTVKIDNDIVGKGYIDLIETEDTEGGEAIIYSGRDKTADLVDCPHAGPDVKSNFEGLPISGIIKRLCDPFDIKVVVDPIVTGVLNDVNNELAKKFVADESIPVIEHIKRLCLRNGVLPLSYGDGFLTLTRATKVNYAYDIITRAYVKSRRTTHSDRERFKTYLVKGQTNDSSFFVTAEEHTEGAGQYTDNMIKRHRPYSIIVEGVSISDCERRAKFEANYRAGNSRSAEYTVEGWRQVGKDNPLWEINMLVRTTDPTLNGGAYPLLISEIERSLTAEGGFETVLKLVHKDTYSLEEAAGLVKAGFDVDTRLGTLQPTAAVEQSWW